MLGALYDALAAALKGHDKEPTSPGIRPSDLERWARAALPVLSFDRGQISRALADNRMTSDRPLVEDDLTASLLVRLLAETGPFQGTSTALLKRLQALAGPEDARHLPKSARALTVHLKRFEQPLERAGIQLERDRGQGGEPLWLIRLKDRGLHEPILISTD
jgi:hypothetical protein